ncbi:MAG: SDR family NAD(P)-dependent oxidoreductase, partial [Bradyrhizobium sp.]|nr:SDR family NAD(P)-dependent oxidoreductase [Bradyrhizobium sp.]
MHIDLSGKTALVTGSIAGIGFTIAKGLAASGAAVVLNGRAQDRVDAALIRLQQAVPAARLHGIAGDVAQIDGGNAVVRALPE